jgi:16S rRNA (cytidine1402-2'-O)-methyltransferase
MAMDSVNDNINSQIIPVSKQEVALYIVPTPIGNLEDITLRALEILRNVDVIACEDTRVTSKMLLVYGFKASMLVYNDFSTEGDRNKIFRALDEGKSVALVSDAGTPLISDPGYKLINEAHKAGYKVISLPGASSVLVALTLSGLPTNRFLFEGFLPVKTKARQDALEKLKNLDATCIFFESARRIVATLDSMLTVFGDRDAAVMRELTKRFEERRAGKLSELLHYYNSNPTPKGEIVIITAPDPNAGKISLSKDELAEKLGQYLTHMTVKEASAKLSEETGYKKSDLYSLALKLQGKK